MSRRLAPCLAHQFGGSPPHMKGILAQDTSGGTKQFLAVADFPALMDGLREYAANMNLYEVLPADRPVYPYVDAEWDPGQLDEEDTLKVVIGLYAHCLNQIGTRTLGVAVYVASGSYAKYPSGRKASYHVIFETDKVFENTLHQAQFFNGVVVPFIRANSLGNLLTFSRAGGSAALALDATVYKGNQSFRLPYQSKLSDAGRPLLPFELEPDFAPVSDLLHVGVYLPPDEIRFITAVNPPATVTTATPATHKKAYALIEGLCPIIHTSIYDDFHTCTKFIWAAWHHEQSDRMRALIHKWCATSSKYSAKWVDSIIAAYKFRGISVGTLIKWAKEADRAATVTLCRAHSTVDELFTVTDADQITYSARYIQPLPQAPTIAVKSHLGTGKTTEIIRILKTAAPKRVLIVSARKSYTHYLQGDLAKAGVPFTSYEDIDSNHSFVPRLIIQVESLWKLGADATYGLVILDESESILNQLHSIQTNGANLITNHQVLEHVTATADRVIAADAFLSDRTATFLKHLRTGHPTTFVTNMYIPYKRQAIHLHPIGRDTRVANIGGFVERALAALAAGRRIVMVWTSRAKGAAFARKYLAQSTYTWRFYSSESPADQTRELADVSTSWQSLQCLMMTTSITVGISYNPSDPTNQFDEAFLYGSSCSALPRDIAQALLRVRELRQNRLTYVLDTRGIGRGICGLEAVKDMLVAKEDRLIKEYPVVKWTTAPQWVRDIHAYNENEAATSRCEYAAVMEEYLRLSGYDIAQETHVPDAALDAATPATAAPPAWDEIEEIDGHTATEIRQAMKAGTATADDIWEWKKWNFTGQFSTDSAPAAWWAKFYVAGREAAFWNIVHEKRFTVEQLATKEGEARYAIMADKGIDRRKTLAQFLALLGMSHSQEEKIFTHADLVALGPQLESVERAVREGIGLRPSRRKGEWAVKNTMDLIEGVLDEWGCCGISNTSNQKRTEGVVVRQYTLSINQGNTIWNKIIDTNTSVSDIFIIKL